MYEISTCNELMTASQLEQNLVTWCSQNTAIDKSALIICFDLGSDKSTTLPASSVHPNVKGDLETDRKVSFCACGALKPGAGAVFGALRPKDVTVGDIGEATGELDGIDWEIWEWAAWAEWAESISDGPTAGNGCATVVRGATGATGPTAATGTGINDTGEPCDSGRGAEVASAGGPGAQEGKAWKVDGMDGIDGPMFGPSLWCSESIEHDAFDAFSAFSAFKCAECASDGGRSDGMADRAGAGALAQVRRAPLLFASYVSPMFLVLTSSDKFKEKYGPQKLSSKHRIGTTQEVEL